MTRERWIVVLLVLLGFWFRAQDLGRNELSYDEEFSYLAVNLGPTEFVAFSLSQAEPHPVLSYFIQTLSYTFGGNNEIAVRLPSALFGAIAVASLYQLLRALRRGAPRGAPALAAGLLAIQTLAVKSGREMRMYSMSMALTLAGSVIMLRLLRKPTRAAWLLYVLVSTAALQVHYYTAFVLVAHNVVAAWLLLTGRLPSPRRALKGWILAQLAVGLITLPWLLYVRDVLIQYGGNESRTRLAIAPLEAAGWLTVGSFQPGWLYPIGGIALVLLALGVARLLRAGRAGAETAVALALLLAIPLGITMFVAQNRNIWAERYVVNAAPYLLGLLAAAVAPTHFGGQGTRSLSRAGAYLATGGVVAALVFGQAGYLAGSVAQDFAPRRAFARMVQRYSQTRPADQIRVVSNYPESSLGMYYQSGPALVTIPAAGNDLESARALVADMRAAGVRRVIFRQVDTLWDSQHVAERGLREKYSLIREDYTGTWIVKIFGHAEPADLRPVQAAYANGMRIDAADILADPVARMIELYLTWSVAGPPAGTEKVFIHVTEAGNPAALIAQEDYALSTADFGGGVRSYGFKFRDDAIVRAGKYVVRIGLYDPAQPGAPRIPTASGGDSHVLAEFDVK
jgi:4-amino-4-deoxy-L-arabinose transferase-like glycosyltransferase